MTDPLETYRRKRDPARTPEPVPPDAPLPQGRDDTFVIQEHHARRLHWDVRLERNGVLVSWAVPKGLPLSPETNHLAVHTEDHPIEYATFSGEIPRGEYGGGTMTLWDRGHYETEKWTDREVKVVFHGSRAEGRYVFFRTRDRDWMVHRMDPPRDPDWRPMPAGLRPMLPVRGSMPAPRERDEWAYEMAWGGVRALVAVEGGRALATDAKGEDVTAAYPELRAMGPALGSRVCLLDGELIALDRDGRPSAALLRRRPPATAPARRIATEVPVTYLLFDVLHLDGRDLTAVPYRDRRSRLDRLGVRGGRWDVAPSLRGDGHEALAASRDLGLAGVVAKRLDSPYQPGRRSPDWRLVDSRETEKLVIGGWIVGGPDDEPDALVVGRHGDEGLEYLGVVRSGLGSDRAELARRLRRLSRKTSPFAEDVPVRQEVQWVRPSITGEVALSPSRRLVWRGFT